jgi:hypothetical protein
MNCPEIIILTISVPASSPPEPDGWQRLRRLLKALVRSYGMRCESIEPGICPTMWDKNEEAK